MRKPLKAAGLDELQELAHESPVQDAAALLQLLAHPQRLRVLCLLTAGERSVGDLNRSVPLSASALSQHLARLRSEGLVLTRKEAQTVYYRIKDGPALDLIQTLHRVYCQREQFVRC